MEEDSQIFKLTQSSKYFLMSISSTKDNSVYEYLSQFHMKNMKNPHYISSVCYSNLKLAIGRRIEKSLVGNIVW